MRSVGFRGLLQVNKPSGMNSTELTNLLKNILRDSGMFPSKKIKVGHSGTLDRFASGLMIVGIGSSCKELHKFLKADKRYVFTAKLGEKTDTLDPSGNLVLQKEWKHISEKDLARTIETFIGKIEQIPPIFSALSMNGTRLHRIARRESGSNLDMIKIPSRTVYIKELILKDFNPPYFTAEAHVGSGTYIRSLARDLGEALGSTGFVTELQRIQVGEFNLIDPVTISKDNWTWEVIKQYLSLEPENLHHAQRNRQSRLSRNVFLTNNAKDKPIF